MSKLRIFGIIPPPPEIVFLFATITVKINTESQGGRGIPEAT